jgi:hypothetical protein
MNERQLNTLQSQPLSMDNRRGGQGGGQGGGRGGGGQGGGNQGPAFTEAEINNFLEIMGEVVPIGPLE